MSYKNIGTLFSNFKTKFRNNPIFETLKHTNNYFIANILTNGVSFLTLPIFTYLMSPADIGYYSVWIALTGFVMIFLTFNLFSSVSRYYFEKTDDFDYFLGTSFIVSLVVSTLTITVYLLYEPFFDSFINLPYPLGPYLIILSEFYVLDAIIKQILLAKNSSKMFFKLTVSRYFIILFISIYLVYVLPTEKYLGRVWPILFINFLYSLYYIYLISRWAKFKITKAHLKYLSLFSLPLLPYSLSGIVLSFYDRILINNVSGATQSGLYSIGYSIGNIIGIASIAINSAQMPEFYRSMREKDFEKYFLMFKRLFSILVVAGLGVMLFSNEIIDILTAPSYHKAVVVISPVVLAYLFNALFYLYGSYILYEKKTVFSSIIIIIAAFINVYTNILLVPLLGIVAGAYTTLLSYFVLFVLAWGVSKFILRQTTVPLRHVLEPIILLLILYGCYYLFTMVFSFYILDLLFKIIIIIVFILIIFHKELKKVLL